MLPSAVFHWTLPQIAAYLLAASVGAWAQQPADLEPAAVKIAVVAVIDRYPAPEFPSSSFARADADILTVALEQRGYRVAVLIDEAATSAAILDAVQQASAKAHDAGVPLIFFFSGCGFETAGKRYLATFDSQAADPAAAAVPVSKLLDSLRAAGGSVGWLDAARPLPKLPPGITPLTPASDSAVSLLWSAGAGSISYDSPELGASVFVHFLVEGWNGEARAVKRGLTFRDLAGYVITATRNWAAAHGYTQTPMETVAPAGDVILDSAESAAGSAMMSAANSVIAEDVEFWRASRDSTVDRLQAYLVRFPDGLFAPVARRRLGTAAPAAARPTSPLDESKLTRGIAYAPDLTELYILRSQLFTDKRNFQSALRDADRAIALDKAIPEAYVLRGHAELEIGKPLDARNDFTEAMRLNPDYPEIYGHRCVADVRLLNFEAGVTDCTEAIRRKSGDPIDLANRGRAYLGLNRPELALADLDASLKLDRRSAGALTTRGLIYATLGQYDNAIGDYDASLTLSAGNPETLVLRGIAHRRSGHCERAIQDFDLALKANGRNASALANRAGCFAYLGQFDHALAELNALIEADASNTVARSERARVYAVAGRYAEALRDWDEVFRQTSPDPADYQGRAIVRLNSGQAELALEDIAQALRLQPDNSSFLSSRATIYDKLGKSDLALKDRETAIRMSPDLASALIAEAQMRRSRKEYEQAIQGYDRAARLRPDDPQLLYDRVSVYLEAGRAADALRVLDEPHKSRLVFSTGSLRALVHSALGQGDLALEEANAAVASNSGVWDGYFAYLGRGTIYRSRNDCARAVEDFSRAIALNIPDQTALAQRAECRITLKQYADAVADLTELITRSPKTPAYYLSRANAYSFMNDNEGAMHDYDEAVALDPKNPFALGNRAMLYGKMGRFADGMPYIDAAIKLKPDSVDLYRLRAQLETDLHQTDKAVADYSSALDLKPDDLEALNGRAWLLNLTGQFSKAIEDYNRSIKVDPKIAWTWVNRGHAYTNSGDWAHAIEDYTHSLALAPETRDALYRRGRCYQNLGQHQKAIADFSAIIVTADSDLEARASRAESLSLTGRAASALEELATVIARDPKNEGAYRVRAAIHERSRDVRGAEADYRSILQLEPNDAGTMNNLGYLLAEADRNLDEAFNLLTRSLGLVPKDDNSLDSMGWICFKLGRLSEAEKYLRDVLARQHNDPVVWDHLAHVLLAEKRNAEAIEAWTSAVRLLENPAPQDRDAAQIERIRKHIEGAKTGGPEGKQL